VLKTRRPTRTLEKLVPLEISTTDKIKGEPAKFHLLSYSVTQDWISEPEDNQEVTYIKSVRNSTGGNHNSSGEAPGNSMGNGSNRKSILGKTKELGELAYRINTKDQANMYLRTTYAIADAIHEKCPDVHSVESLL
jgi:hypothetical protein